MKTTNEVTLNARQKLIVQARAMNVLAKMAGKDLMNLTGDEQKTLSRFWITLQASAKLNLIR